MQTSDHETQQTAPDALRDYQRRTKVARNRRLSVVLIAAASLGITSSLVLAAATRADLAVIDANVVLSALTSLLTAFSGMAVALDFRRRIERERATPVHIAQRLALQEYGLSLLHHDERSLEEASEPRVFDLMRALEESVAAARAEHRHRSRES